MLFVKGLGDFFLGTRIGQALGIAVIAVLALMIWSHRVEQRGVQKGGAQVVAQAAKATETEADRRVRELEKAQKISNAEIAELRKQVASRERLLEKLKDESPGDSPVCLGADSVRTLDAIR